MVKRCVSVLFKFGQVRCRFRKRAYSDTRGYRDALAMKITRKIPALDFLQYAQCYPGGFCHVSFGKKNGELVSAITCYDPVIANAVFYNTGNLDNDPVSGFESELFINFSAVVNVEHQQ